jgi:hypothetical protein
MLALAFLQALRRTTSRLKTAMNQIASRIGGNHSSTVNPFMAQHRRDAGHRHGKQ